MRDEGDLHITTIKDLMDYLVLLENISFEYMPDGGIEIYNHNDEPVKGLSLAVHTKNILINGETPSFRHVNDNIIVWFDMPARGQVEMEIQSD